MPAALPANPESVFTYGAPQLKFGTGASDEIGYDLSLTGATRVLVVTDPGIAATGTPWDAIVAVGGKDVTEDDVAGTFRRSLSLW